MSEKYHASDPFIIVPKPPEGWPDKRVLVEGRMYQMVGGELYAPEDAEKQELQQLYAYWSNEHWLPYDEKHAWIEQVGEQCADIALAHFGNAIIDQRVLDMACGTGLASLGLRRKIAFRGLYAGIDFTPAMLSWAQRKSELATSAFVQADVRELPFGPQTFGLVMGSLFINHIPPDQYDELFSATYNILQPNGMLILIDTQQNPGHDAVRESMQTIAWNYTLESRRHYNDTAPNGFELNYHVAVKCSED